MKEIFNFIEQDVQVGLTILFACCVFTVLAAFFDMWTALEAVRATGAKPESRPLMKTGLKIMDHLRLIAYVLMIDILGLLCFSWYGIPYCAVIMTMGILCREGLSMRENYILKKSNAVDAMDYAAKIVQCVTKEDADKIIRSIHDTQQQRRKQYHENGNIG